MESFFSAARHFLGGLLPRLAFHELATLKASSLQPFKHGLLRDAECIGGTLHRVAAIWPARRIVIDAVDLGCRDIPARAEQMDGAMIKRPAAGIRKALGIEDLGDLSVHAACGVEFAEVCGLEQNPTR